MDDFSQEITTPLSPNPAIEAGAGDAAAKNDGGDRDRDDDGRRRRPYQPYLPACPASCLPSPKGSVRLAFLSHACFLAGSLLYVRASSVELALARAGDAPEDDGGATKLANVLGAASFALVGLVDWARHRNALDLVMILAGAAGVASGLSETALGEEVWDVISVHLFLMEGVNLVRRDRNHGGLAWFLLGDVCFLMGCILDCLVSYLSLAGLGQVLGVVITSMTSNVLWLACSLIGIVAEIHHLRKQKHKGSNASLDTEALSD